MIIPHLVITWSTLRAWVAPAVAIVVVKQLSPGPALRPMMGQVAVMVIQCRIIIPVVAFRPALLTLVVMAAVIVLLLLLGPMLRTLVVLAMISILAFLRRLFNFLWLISFLTVLAMETDICAESFPWLLLDGDSSLSEFVHGLVVAESPFHGPFRGCAWMLGVMLALKILFGRQSACGLGISFHLLLSFSVVLHHLFQLVLSGLLLIQHLLGLSCDHIFQIVAGFHELVGAQIHLILELLVDHWLLHPDVLVLLTVQLLVQ